MAPNDLLHKYQSMDLNGPKHKMDPTKYVEFSSILDVGSTTVVSDQQMLKGEWCSMDGCELSSFMWLLLC